MIAVGGREQPEGLSTVSRTEQASVKHIDRVDRLGIGKDVGEIPCALAITLIVVNPCPVLASVVRAIQAALLRFDERIYAVGITPGDAHSNASQYSVRQAFSLQTLPGGAAIDGFVQTAARSATVQAVGCTNHLPQRGEHDVGVVGIENYVNAAVVIIFVEDFVPCSAAIAGAKDATFGIGAVGVS